MTPAADIEALEIVRPGDVLETWCSACNDQTPHRWEGWRLVCENCEQEDEDDL